jgi:pilus assembly protein CpaB
VKANRRARLVAVAGAAVFLGGAAATVVSGREARVRAQVGPLVPVVVAAEDIRAGKLITLSTRASLLARRRVPARFVPPQALRRPDEAVGFRPGVDLAAGDYVTSGLLEAPDDTAQSDAVGRGGEGRPVEVSVAGAATLLDQLGPGARVDVLVTSDRGGPARTYLAMQNVELLSAAGDASGSTSGSSDRPADAIATLRVSLREALTLTAAQNFAREIRLVPRPDGERRLSGSLAVTAPELRP